MGAFISMTPPYEHDVGQVHSLDTYDYLKNASCEASNRVFTLHSHELASVRPVVKTDVNCPKQSTSHNY